jgi:hypothetical protein
MTRGDGAPRRSSPGLFKAPLPIGRTPSPNHQGANDFGTTALWSWRSDVAEREPDRRH